jgi:hypothetical protein
VGLDGAYLVRRSLVWAVVSHLADWEAQTMTRDEIIRMADEAKLIAVMEMFEEEVERFAALVAAAERAECAKVCDELAALNRSSPADSMWQWGECAAAIRARDPLNRMSVKNKRPLPEIPDEM